MDYPKYCCDCYANLHRFPSYLQAFYKWKYPEEYREWEGKTVEEWYGEKIFKKTLDHSHLRD